MSATNTYVVVNDNTLYKQSFYIQQQEDTQTMAPLIQYVHIVCPILKANINLASRYDLRKDATAKTANQQG